MSTRSSQHRRRGSRETSSARHPTCQKIETLAEEKSPLVALKPGEKIPRLNYIKKNTSEALISEASRRFIAWI
ncbi:MAG: hypothetical protein ACLUAR_16715 [Pilosibacter sp.]